MSGHRWLPIVGEIGAGVGAVAMLLGLVATGAAHLCCASKAQGLDRCGVSDSACELTRTILHTANWSVGIGLMLAPVILVGLEGVKLLSPTSGLRHLVLATLGCRVVLNSPVARLCFVIEANGHELVWLDPKLGHRIQLPLERLHRAPATRTLRRDVPTSDYLFTILLWIPWKASWLGFDLYEQDASGVLATPQGDYLIREPTPVPDEPPPRSRWRLAARMWILDRPSARR